MPHQHPEIRLQPKGRFPWPLVAIVIALAILAAIVWFTPRINSIKATPHPPANAYVPVQPTGDQLQLTDVHLKSSPDPNSSAMNVDVEGKLFNIGNRAVNGILVRGVFMDGSGKEVLQQAQPVFSLEAANNGQEGRPVDMKNAPVQANGVSPFRITFSSVPSTWNRQKPELNIIRVSKDNETGAQELKKIP